MGNKLRALGVCLGVLGLAIGTSALEEEDAGSSAIESNR